MFTTLNALQQGQVPIGQVISTYGPLLLVAAIITLAFTIVFVKLSKSNVKSVLPFFVFAVYEALFFGLVPQLIYDVVILLPSLIFMVIIVIIAYTMIPKEETVELIEEDDEDFSFSNSTEVVEEATQEKVEEATEEKVEEVTEEKIEEVTEEKIEEEAQEETNK